MLGNAVMCRDTQNEVKNFFNIEVKGYKIRRLLNRSWMDFVKKDMSWNEVSSEVANGREEWKKKTFASPSNKFGKKGKKMFVW